MASQILQILSVVTAVASLGWIIWVGRKLQVLDDLQATSEKIKHNVKVISDFLIAKAGDFNHSELQNYSPLALTENGEKFIRDLGFDKVFEANKADFFNCIDHDAPKLKYDVEISAIRSI